MKDSERQELERLTQMLRSIYDYLQKSPDGPPAGPITRQFKFADGSYAQVILRSAACFPT